MHHSTTPCDGYFNKVTWSRSACWCHLHGSAKAFDTVPHIFYYNVIARIECYGITGILKWIVGFLFNRRQAVCCFKWEKSSWKDVKSNVPQGTTLGPLLSLTYVNDLPRSISSQVFLFGDNTKNMWSISTLADHVCTASNWLR